MDIVLNRLKLRNQALVNIITSILGAMCCGCVVWFAAHNAWGFFQTGYHEGTILAIPVFHLHIILALGSFLLFVQFLRRAYGYRQSWRT